MTGGPDDPFPHVSVVIPMLNEHGYIEPCIRGFLDQSYPAELIEILVVDGGSTDGSRDDVDAIAVDHPQVRLIDNPRRVAAAAANIGIANAKGDVLCFLSAHGVPDPDYVATSVRLLLETGAVGVGGRYVHEGVDRSSRAIGLAMASRLGMASPHRSSSQRMDVDTISHPTFHKQPMIEAGGYDETLRSNEDYEFNYRLRLNGGRLVFCPEISSVYRPRRSLKALGRQFFAYGRGKASVMRRHPSSVRGRHLVPPAAFVAAVATALALPTRTGRRVAVAAALGYAVVEVAALADARPQRHDASVGVFVAAFPVMHLTWGAGVVVGAAREWWSERTEAPTAVGRPAAEGTGTVGDPTGARPPGRSPG